MRRRRKVYQGALGLLVLALLLPAVATAQVSTSVIFSDDFEDGVVDTSVYTAIGNAVITESGGRMHIRTFGPDDGVEIAIPDNTACMQIQLEIPEVEFDRFESFGVSAFLIDPDGNELLGVGAELLRPFWNRCQVTWKFGDQTQTEGIWG